MAELLAEQIHYRIGDAILAARNHARLSSQQLADRLGCSVNTVSAYIRGERRAYTHTLYWIEAICGVPHGYIWDKAGLTEKGISPGVEVVIREKSNEKIVWSL